MPGITPSTAPSVPTTMVSAVIMPSTCLGVAPIALNSASSRSRCRTDSASVLATTIMITRIMLPPNARDSSLMNERVLAMSRNSASLRKLGLAVSDSGHCRVLAVLTYLNGAGQIGGD
jgi:hypothetical protein